MGCEFYPVGDNGVAIICGRGRRTSPCSVCHARPGTKLCDFKLTGRKAGKTCDRSLCERCAVRMGVHEDGLHKGDGIDFCPAHARQATAPPDVSMSARSSAPSQADLFTPPKPKR